VRVYFESVQGVPAGTEETLNVLYAHQTVKLEDLNMEKQMKPGRRYFIINIDEPYAVKIYQALKEGQTAKGEWPEGDISFEEWKHQTFDYTVAEYLGSDIETVVKVLLQHRERGELVKTNFNGHWLYSDTVTMDGAYVAITGKTKAEFGKAQQEWRDEYDRKEREHKAKIPDLMEEWRQKGHEILAEKYWQLWDKCVPIRLGDLYHGMELGCCLDIVKILNDGGSLEDAKAKIVSQNHSGMSWGLVKSMIKSFCDRGEEFMSRIS
jgi:hypothetical protein